MENIEVKVLDDKLSNWRLLVEPWYQFFRHEPICSMIPGLHDPQNKEFICELLYKNFVFDPDSPCIYAWDKERHQAVGVVQCSSVYRHPPPEQEGGTAMNWFTHTWDDDSTSKLKALDEFLEMMMKKADVIQRYGIDKALLINITSVCPEYKRRGIANVMTAKVLEVAKERGYPLVMSESTSAFTQRNKINRFEFEPLMDFDFKDNYANYPEMPEEVKKTHSKAMVLIKKLS